MKYNKSDFTLVPSRQARIGMPANQQVVYMWLCEHSNDNMQSFPSRKVLAYECGMSPSTLDRTIELLENSGFIVRESRYKENKQISNLYTVLIVNKGSHIDEGGVVILNSPPSHIDEQNYTHLTQSITNVIEEPVKKEIKVELQAFKEMRKLMRKPLTVKGCELIVKKLEKLYPGDYVLQKLSLDQSVEHSWLSVFEVKPENLPQARRFA